jgi:hypothetical protein
MKRENVFPVLQVFFSMEIHLWNCMGIGQESNISGERQNGKERWKLEFY